ncbi:MAG: hypothetical protein ACPGN3_07030 [Opitutales bacterium]
MNSEEAKFTLQSFRPGTEDENDPIFLEALSMLETDPELAQWYSENSTFDAEMREKLSDVEPPSDLQTTILAGMRASAAQPHAEETIQEEEPVATTRRSFWLRTETLSIAAIFLIVFLWADPLSMRGFRAEPGAAAEGIPSVLAHLTDHYETFPGFELKSSNLDDLLGHFEANGISSPKYIPTALADNPNGCLSIDIDGNPIGMICFNYGLNTMHLYTIPEAAFADHAPISEPKIFEDRGRGYKVWKQDEQFYVLATEGKTDRLKEIF